MKYAFGFAATFLCALGADTATLKTLNVAVVDAGGQPVNDLRAADFQLFEDGKQKNLAFFRFTGGKAIQAALGPGQISNRTGVPIHATVILIDLMSDAYLSGGAMGKEIGDTLKRLETSDDVYLYFLTSRGDVYPVHALPEPGYVETAPAEPWTRNAPLILEAAVKRVAGLRPKDEWDPGTRFKATANAIGAIGGEMWRFPGRKNLVWVTHGAPLSAISLGGGLLDFTDPVRKLAERFEMAQVSVYAVQQAMRGVTENLATYDGQMLDLVSSLTGGRTYRTDEAGVALQQARNDARGNYQIGYESEHLNANGKRHKIRVTCAGKDVRLQTEQEFYSLGLALPGSGFERAALEAAKAISFEASEIALRGSVSPGAGNSMRLDLRIDPKDLYLRQTKGRYVGKVSVNFATYDGEDRASAFRPIPLDVNLTPQQYEAAAGDGITVQQNIPVDAAARKVRAIVVDKELRAVGSITMPVRR